MVATGAQGVSSTDCPMWVVVYPSYGIGGSDAWHYDMQLRVTQDVP